jgi:hypothetical protein
MFTGNTPFDQNIRARHVSDVIVLAGAPSVVVWSGDNGVVCVSWHGRGRLYENFDFVADHGVMNAEADVAFQVWCQVAYAWEVYRRHAFPTTAEHVTIGGPSPAPGNLSIRATFSEKISLDKCFMNAIS